MTDIIFAAIGLVIIVAVGCAGAVIERLQSSQCAENEWLSIGRGLCVDPKTHQVFTMRGK